MRTSFTLVARHRSDATEIVSVAQPYLDSDFEMTQYWGDEDRDIYIFLPEIKDEPIDTEPTFDIPKWLGSTRTQVNRPFISTEFRCGCWDDYNEYAKSI